MLGSCRNLKTKAIMMIVMMLNAGKYYNVRLLEAPELVKRNAKLGHEIWGQIFQ